MSGARIIKALKEAQAAKFARVYIEGQTWVRQDTFDETVGALAYARRFLTPFADFKFIDAALKKARGE